MINFNAQRPASLQQLASFYSGNPNVSPEEASNGLNSQQRGYMQAQGASLGIGDPQEYFSKQQLANKMQNTQSMGQQADFISAQRQLATMQSNGASAAEFAPLQNAFQTAMHKTGDPYTDQMHHASLIGAMNQPVNPASSEQARMSAYPMPMLGQSPDLRPLQMQDAARQGMTPEAYNIKQRLAPGNRSADDTGAGAPWVPNNQKGNVNPEELYNKPEFQTVLQQQPDRAAQAFHR